MKNNLEDEKILPIAIRNVMDIIIKKCPTAIFGGSIGLNAVGLINRPIKDIDLMIPPQQYNYIKEYICPDDENVVSEDFTDVNGNKIRRVHARINDVNICIFYVPVSLCSPFEFSGRKIFIENCNQAILAKLAYARKNTPSALKHKADINQIAGTIDEITDDLPF